MATAETFGNLRSKTWRVVNKKDIVPHLPFENMLGLQYHHQPQEVG
jgi:hypothetical protein